jgi:hypothetical protein
VIFQGTPADLLAAADGSLTGSTCAASAIDPDAARAAARPGGTCSSRARARTT